MHKTKCESCKEIWWRRIRWRNKTSTNLDPKYVYNTYEICAYKHCRQKQKTPTIKKYQSIRQLFLKYYCGDCHLFNSREYYYYKAAKDMLISEIPLLFSVITFVSRNYVEYSYRPSTPSVSIPQYALNPASPVKQILQSPLLLCLRSKSEQSRTLFLWYLSPLFLCSEIAQTLFESI